MQRISCSVLAIALLSATLHAATLNSGDQIVTTFTAAPNTSDILLFFSNDPLTVTGSPVLTANLYNGATLLGTYTAKPFVFNGITNLVVAFASLSGGSGVAMYSPAKVDFTSINNGTISGRLVTTISGGSISGFNLGTFFLYDATSVSNGYQPLTHITRTSLVLVAAPVLSHLAAGESWTTGIMVVNTSTQAANFSIVFRDDNGNMVPLPFASGATSTLSGTIPALGSAYFEAADPTARLVSASGQIAADASIVIQGLFRNNVNGTFYEAAVPSSTPVKEFEIPFDATTFTPTNSQIYTGLAIVNTDQTTTASVSCIARNAAGTIIPNGVTVPAIKPLGHWADYIFPALIGQRGTLDCTSNTFISAIALRAVGSALSTLTVIPK